MENLKPVFTVNGKDYELKRTRALLVEFQKITEKNKMSEEDANKYLEIRETFDEMEKEIIAGKELPQMNPGDTVKVFVRIIEGNKERTQAFEGTLIKEHGSGLNKTITVRKVFQGVGVERVFLVNSPRIEKINVLRRGDVRRSKLYYLRERSGKATRIKEKIEKR